MSAELNFESILEHFYVEGKVVDCVRYGEGHINDTFKATMDVEGKELHYILQRINNRLFTDVEKLMRNIELVTEFCRRSVEDRGGDPQRECLTLIRTKDGKAYYFDGKDYFRVYVFIENATTYQSVREPRDFYESAVAFGNFANLLAGFDASQLYEVLPDFHNTKVRYANFVTAVQKDVCGRNAEVEKEIEQRNDRRCDGQGDRGHRFGYGNARQFMLRLRRQYSLRVQRGGGGRAGYKQSAFCIRPIQDLSRRIFSGSGKEHYAARKGVVAVGRGTDDVRVRNALFNGLFGRGCVFQNAPPQTKPRPRAYAVQTGGRHAVCVR